LKCLRCGRCCITHLVVIVDDPQLGPVEDNLKCRGGEGPCQHLTGSGPGKYSCAIHDMPWYGETPCARHGQIERSPDDECRLGRWVLDNLKNEETR